MLSLKIRILLSFEVQPWCSHPHITFPDIHCYSGVFPHLNAYIYLFISFWHLSTAQFIIFIFIPTILTVKMKLSCTIVQVNYLCFLYSNRTHWIGSLLFTKHQSVDMWVELTILYTISLSFCIALGYKHKIFKETELTTSRELREVFIMCIHTYTHM